MSRQHSNNSTSNICRRCGKPLKDPLSQQIGLGPVCRLHDKNGNAGGPTLDMFGGADFTFAIKGPVVVIQDLNSGGRSVTNDLYNVLSAIESEVGSLKDRQLIYKDSFGVWDRVVIDEISGTPRIVSLRETSEQAAFKKALRLCEKD